MPVAASNRGVHPKDSKNVLSSEEFAIGLKAFCSFSVGRSKTRSTFPYLAYNSANVRIEIMEFGLEILYAAARFPRSRTASIAVAQSRM